MPEGMPWVAVNKVLGGGGVERGGRFLELYL